MRIESFDRRWVIVIRQIHVCSGGVRVGRKGTISVPAPYPSRRTGRPAARQSSVRDLPAALAPLGKVGAFDTDGRIVAVAGIDPRSVRQRAKDLRFETVNQGL